MQLISIFLPTVERIEQTGKSQSSVVLESYKMWHAYINHNRFFPFILYLTLSLRGTDFEVCFASSGNVLITLILPLLCIFPALMNLCPFSVKN